MKNAIRCSLFAFSLIEEGGGLWSLAGEYRYLSGDEVGECGASTGSATAEGEDGE